MYWYEYLLVYVLIGLLNNKITIVQSFNMQRYSNDYNFNLDAFVHGLKQQHSRLNEREYQVNTANHQLEEEKRQIQQLVNPHDLIRLNVGGQILVTRRQTLTKVSNSLLAAAFNGSNNWILQPDYDGSYFLDYNPLLFSHLLDQLRTLRINDTPVFRPPSSSVAKPFNKMLRELKLPCPSLSGDDIIALNVGGEKIVTLRKTLTGVPKSNLSRLASALKSIKRDRFGRPFLNYDPKLFRYLLNQLQQSKEMEDLKPGKHLKEYASAYQAMLIDLGLQKSITSTPRTTTKKKKAVPSAIRKSLATQRISTDSSIDRIGTPKQQTVDKITRLQTPKTTSKKIQILNEQILQGAPLNLHNSTARSTVTTTEVKETSAETTLVTTFVRNSTMQTTKSVTSQVITDHHPSEQTTMTPNSSNTETSAITETIQDVLHSTTGISHFDETNVDSLMNTVSSQDTTISEFSSERIETTTDQTNRSTQNLTIVITQGIDNNDTSSAPMNNNSEEGATTMDYTDLNISVQGFSATNSTEENRDNQTMTTIPNDAT